MIPVPMTRLTSVYGSFRARVVAARLEDEGFDVTLRGAIDGPYVLTVGELARVDLYVPEDQVEEASIVLLATEVDAALEPSEPRAARRRVHGWWLGVAVIVVLAAGPVVQLLRS